MPDSTTQSAQYPQGGAHPYEGSAGQDVVQDVVQERQDVDADADRRTPDAHRHPSTPAPRPPPAARL